MKDALKNIYTESLKHINLKKNDVVLDIGANDGTLLKYYKKNGYRTIGCEPANNLKKELSTNCDHVINNFWSYKELNKILKRKKLKNQKLSLLLVCFMI